jgi:hypothetical protein
MMRVYSELSGKIKYAAATGTIEEFLSRLARRFGVRDLTNKHKILEHLDNVNNKELLRYIRNNTEFIIILVREHVETKKQAYEKKKKETKDKRESLFM